MKNQLSIQEKLWDLRRDHDYKLEEVAAAVNVVPATISKYENKENKEYNIVTLNKLAEFYGVSLEWLVGNTEARTSSLTDIDELMLDDETIDLLKSGHFNSRLLCEIIKHPDFIKLMTDTEIYVDGIATMQIKNMNDWLDAVRLQIIQQKNPDANDLYLKVLESSHIQEEEYFFHTIHSDWDNIIRTTVSTTISPRSYRPFSTRGTKSGQAAEYTRVPGRMADKVRSYTPVRMDACVPISPTFPFLVAWAAARQAGSTTPNMGMSLFCRSTSSAVVDTVPQAITTALGSNRRKKATSCSAYLMIVWRERPP